MNASMHVYSSYVGGVATLAVSIVNGGCFVFIEEGGRTFARSAGASHGSLRASLRGKSDSTLNPSCDSPHTGIGTVHVHASIHTNIRARAP